MLTGRRYRLELTVEQTAQCEEFANVCRAVWNTGLEQRREYRRRGAWMNYAPQCKELAEAKREHVWLRVAPSHILQQTLKDLDRACREHGTFKVRWRSRVRWSPSFRFPDAQQIQVERQRHAMPGSAVGIDRGVKFAAVTSDGDFHDRAFIRPGEAERYRRLQQQLSRTHRGSANRAKTRARMNKIMGRVTDRRGDFCAQTAGRIVRKNALVVLEDLRIKNMSASASGTLAEPGRQVRQKAGLNRAILDKGWHRLERALTSAARYTGTSVVKVDPAYTSQRCSACGFVTEGNRESQAVFACKAPGCGHREHADVNAGKNIKAAGLAASACGDLGTGRSVKQEPVSRATGRTPQRGIHALQGMEDVKGTVIPWPPPRP
ncbi:RNA-guided endonuclease InsQ/TnpB family protein [Streptomyces sp. NPDC059695]|uniref:RNA-guided endonuclease InsQ/TnpB family protein n=1 Tax=Streptomyces sp. NPDC059695 TaxID=3346910 RepID=UPI00367642F7